VGAYKIINSRGAAISAIEQGHIGCEMLITFRLAD
jgi:hypothetical protein